MELQDGTFKNCDKITPACKDYFLINAHLPIKKQSNED